MLWNLPNTLTWLRIAAIPLIILLFLMPYHWSDPAAGLLFAAAGITDSLDGYFARRLGQTSRLGAFLDPVADKLIVAVALVLLISKDTRALIVLTAVGDHRPGDHDLSAAGMDGGDRRAAQGGRVAARQDQDRPADRGPLDDALSQRRSSGCRSIGSAWRSPSSPRPRPSSRWWRICGPRGRSSGAELPCLDFAGPALKIPSLTRGAGIAQLVERNLAKVEVASSSLVSRSICTSAEFHWLPGSFARL